MNDSIAASKLAAPSPDQPYETFLARLQAAVRANDRRSVIGLIAFPLRVNSKGGARFYRNARSVERDYERIFTPKVSQAILAQRPDQLFVRDVGAMVGDGEVWFAQTCAKPTCPVRITAVNR